MGVQMQNTVRKVLVLLLFACVFAQDGQHLKMKALGRPAHLGFLYDARREQFLDFSVFKETLPEAFVKTITTPFSNVKTSMANTFQEKFNLFDVSASLSASVLSGMLTIKGSAKFLMSPEKHSKDFTGALLLECKTVTESLELYYTDLKHLFNTELIEGTDATHVVTGISWGANVAVIFKDTVTDEKDETKIAGSLEIEFKKLAGPFQVSGDASVDIHGKESNETSTFALSVQGDLLLPDQVPTTHEEVTQLIRKVPQLISSTSGGKGVPIEFTLTPIGHLRTHLQSTAKGNSFAAKVEETILNDFITKFDDILNVEKLVNDNYELFTQNKVCVLPDTLAKIIKLHSNFVTAKIAFTTAFQRALIKVRSSEAESKELLELIELYESNEFSATNVAILLRDFQEARNKVDMYKVIANSNSRIQYFGATNNLDAALVANANKVMYILFFKSEWIENDVTAWENTIHTFLHILNKPHNTLLVADCDFPIRKCNALNRTVVTQLVEGKAVLEDVDAAIRIPSDNFKLTLKGLGTLAKIGELYDARTDTFLGASILGSSHSKSLIQSTDQNTIQIVTLPSESIQDKLSAFQVTEEQRLSILAGSVPSFRSGNYLAMSTETRSEQVYRQSLLQTVRTKDEMLDFNLPDFTNDLVQENLFLKEATHFISKVEHGINAVFSIESTCTITDAQADRSRSLNRDDCNTQFQQFKASFFHLISKITFSEGQNLTLTEDLQFLETSTLNYKIVVHSDTQARDSPPMTFDNKDSFLYFLTREFIPNHNEENAPAITYYLTPVSSLQKIGIIAPRISYGALTSDKYAPSDVVSILADIELAREQIFQVSLKLWNYAHCITDQDFNLVKQIETEFESSVDGFQANYKNTVSKIKSGTLSQDSLEKLISEYTSFALFDNSKILTRLQPLLPAEQRVRFCKTFDNTSVKYLGRESSSVNFRAIFDPKPVRVSMVYLLHFKSSWMVDNNGNSEEWQITSQRFVGQLSRRVRNNPAVYYIVDCDFDHKHCANITRPSIFEYKNGRLTTTDYTETVEEEEMTLQGQLDALNARVMDKIATVETEVTRNKNDIARVTNKMSSVGTELTKNKNDMGELQTELHTVNTTANQNKHHMLALGTALKAVNGIALQNQAQIYVTEAFMCESQKPAFIGAATKSASFGCGGTIQLPSAGKSIVVDFNLAPTKGSPQSCLWTLVATQKNKLVAFKVKLTLLCKNPTQILDENKLTFTEWYLLGTNKEMTTSKISSSSQNSILHSKQLDYRGFLSFNSKRVHSEAGFILRIDVLETTADLFYSSSSVTHTMSAGSAAYSLPTSFFDISSVVINPEPNAKMTLTVDVDSSGQSNPCGEWDSVDFLEFGMDGVPKQLGRLCGQQSAISYETENPVAALFHWWDGRSGRGVEMSWK